MALQTSPLLNGQENEFIQNDKSAIARVIIDGSEHGGREWANASSTSSTARELSSPRSATTHKWARSRQTATRGMVEDRRENWSGPARQLFADGMKVSTASPRGPKFRAPRSLRSHLLGNHLLYCTVCDNNNGNCTVHNTTKLLAVEHQNIPFKHQALRSRLHESLLPL